MTRKRKGPTPARPWQRLSGPVSGVNVRGEDTGGVWFGNDLYSVSVTINNAKPGPFPCVAHLSIHRKDRKALLDWRHLQRIKNEICGPEAEACQLFPAESRVYDTANEFHLFVLLAADAVMPFGDFSPRVVADHDPDDRSGAVQRPLDPDTMDVIDRATMREWLRADFPEDYARLYPEGVNA